MEIEIRSLTTVEELQQIMDVEKEIWNFPPIPIHQTLTVAKNGGIILGAFVEEKMIGFLYSFPGFNGKSIYLCSHMLGILPPYQKQGIGAKLKRKQAELAKQFGYQFITWTFDPLESKNAYFNLHKLGAKGAHYEENYYGYLQDKLNKGLPTDRMIIEWDVRAETSKPEVEIKERSFLLLKDEKLYPQITEQFEVLDTNPQNYWFVTIPNDFQQIKKTNIDLAHTWRLETRKVFQKLFSLDYEATDLITDEENRVCYYIFTKRGGFM